MRSGIWFINVVLAAGVIFFGIKTYQVWFAPEKPITNPKSAQSSSAQPEKRILPKTVPPQTSYQIVAEKTIFSPDRKETVKNAETVQTAKAPAKFNLSGIMISGGYKFAFITDAAKPGTKPRRVKEGDSLDDLKVSAIQKDRIILIGADSRQEILLYDEAKIVRREQVQKDAEPIIIAGSESQSKQTPLASKEEKPAVNPLTAPPPISAEKKPESPPPDRKPVVSQAIHQPAPAKTQTKPVHDDMNNPILNLFRGMK
ncbi:MAG: hypothetical protein BWK80_17090 [Desulfobacteraceae bacterium IS3]|jgi:hypothetical protein|nr:MAG: hypothetical protein BWK80_17090 [Desulfobacteraceae bacterium IS3]